MYRRLAFILLLKIVACFPHVCLGQEDRSSSEVSNARSQEIQLGSRTAKAGFENEDQIRDKFNNWQQDSEAQDWLHAMDYPSSKLIEVLASKPHGEKADVELTIKTMDGQFREGISIKLVSNPKGFNQIDKRRLKNYAAMWAMPAEVQDALRLFVGEIPPDKPGRDKRRMFLDEMENEVQQKIVQFFTENRQRIVNDLFTGQGAHAATWWMVTFKPIETERDSDKLPTDNNPAQQLPHWTLLRASQAATFYGDGPIELTRSGSLRIGRITMQRKGGDNGRASANMLQFKVNPIEIIQRKP